MLLQKEPCNYNAVVTSMNVYLLLPLISHLIDEAMKFPQFLQAHAAVLAVSSASASALILHIRELPRGNQRSCRIDPRLFKRISFRRINESPLPRVKVNRLVTAHEHNRYVLQGADFDDHRVLDFSTSFPG